jgi:hypothetical protein
MHPSFKKLSLALSFPLLGLSASTLQAQSLYPYAAQEFVYNGTYSDAATSTSNYAVSNVATGFGEVDLYLSDWGNPVGRQFIYQFTDPGDPSSVVHQGSFFYMDVVDMQVGAVWNSYTNNMNLLVAYTWGTDHYLDIYDLTTSTSNPVVLNTSMQLSNCNERGRIRMDCHKMYGVAIIWENKGVGLQTLTGNAGAWGQTVTLQGTQWASKQDVAFSHSSGGLNVHYAYYQPGTNTIVESVLDWAMLMALPSPATLSPVVEDVNFVGSAPSSYIVLDCPDHYNEENWAYTYTDGDNIFVRHKDYNSTAVATTVSVNSGVLGNASTIGLHQVFLPTLYYGAGAVDGRSGQIHVGWYATDLSNFNGYLALEMTADGTTMLSGGDYQELPNAYTPSLHPYYAYPYQADLTHIKPGIAFSKNSDGMNTEYMYTTYYEAANPVAGKFHHAFHKWNDPAFKGHPGVTPHPECGAQLKKVIGSDAKINSYPNPFRDKINTPLFLAEDGQLQQSLTDITGRELWHYKANIAKGAHQVSTDNLAELVPGTYILTTSLNGKKLSTQKVTKQ